MAYTATVISKAVNGNAVEVTVDFTEGGTTLRDTFRVGRPTQVWLEGAVRERIAQLNTLAPFLPTVPLGPLVPPVIVVPPFETDKLAWRNTVNKLRIALLVFPDTDPVVTGLRANLIATYQAGFLD